MLFIRDFWRPGSWTNLMLFCAAWVPSCRKGQRSPSQTTSTSTLQFIAVLRISWLEQPELLFPHSSIRICRWMIAGIIYYMNQFYFTAHWECHFPAFALASRLPVCRPLRQFHHCSSQTHNSKCQGHSTWVQLDTQWCVLQVTPHPQSSQHSAPCAQHPAGQHVLSVSQAPPPGQHTWSGGKKPSGQQVAVTKPQPTSGQHAWPVCEVRVMITAVMIIAGVIIFQCTER